MGRKMSRYNPKGANPQAWVVAMQGPMLLSRHDQSTRALNLHICVDRIARGEADHGDWRQVFDVCNLLEELGKNPRVMQGAQEFVEHCQEQIVSIMDRHKANPASRAVKAEELQALRDMETLWAEVLGIITHHQYFVAEQAVNERTRRVLAGQTNGARVVSV